MPDVQLPNGQTVTLPDWPDGIEVLDHPLWQFIPHGTSVYQTWLASLVRPILDRALDFIQRFEAIIKRRNPELEEGIDDKRKLALLREIDDKRKLEPLRDIDRAAQRYFTGLMAERQRGLDFIESVIRQATEPPVESGEAAVVQELHLQEARIFLRTMDALHRLSTVEREAIEHGKFNLLWALQTSPETLVPAEQLESVRRRVAFAVVPAAEAALRNLTAMHQEVGSLAYSVQRQFCYLLQTNRILNEQGRYAEWNDGAGIVSPVEAYLGQVVPKLSISGTPVS